VGGRQKGTGRDGPIGDLVRIASTVVMMKGTMAPSLCNLLYSEPDGHAATAISTLNGTAPSRHLADWPLEVGWRTVCFAQPGGVRGGQPWDRPDVDSGPADRDDAGVHQALEGRLAGRAWMADSERVGASDARPGNSVLELRTTPNRAVRRRFRCRRPSLTSLAPAGVPIADRGIPTQPRHVPYFVAILVA